MPAAARPGETQPESPSNRPTAGFSQINPQGTIGSYGKNGRNGGMSALFDSQP